MVASFGIRYTMHELRAGVAAEDEAATYKKIAPAFRMAFEDSCSTKCYVSHIHQT